MYSLAGSDTFPKEEYWNFWLVSNAENRQLCNEDHAALSRRREAIHRLLFGASPGRTQLTANLQGILVGLP
jgi:hypothetical protein